MLFIRDGLLYESYDDMHAAGQRALRAGASEPVPMEEGMPR